MLEHVVWSQIFSPGMLCLCFVQSPKPSWASQLNIISSLSVRCSMSWVKFCYWISCFGTRRPNLLWCSFRKWINLKDTDSTSSWNSAQWSMAWESSVTESQNILSCKGPLPEPWAFSGCEFSCATLLTFPSKNLCHPFDTKTTGWSCCAPLSTSTLAYLAPEGHSPFLTLCNFSQCMNIDLKHLWEVMYSWFFHV